MATLGQRLMLEARASAKAAASKEPSATKLFDEAAGGTAAGSSSSPGGSSIEFKRIPRATVMSKLVLRSGASMRSQRLRDITAGASVLIVDSVESPSCRGVVRAKIAVESSPRGVAVLPLGWVTAHKEGDHDPQKLEVVPEGRHDLSPRARSPRARSPRVGSPRVRSPRGVDSSSVSPDATMDEAAYRASLAKRIAERRLAKAERREAERETDSRREAEADATSAKRRGGRRAVDHDATRMRPSKSQLGAEQTGESRPGVTKESKEVVYPWLSAASLRKQTAELEARAVRAESGAADDGEGGAAGGTNALLLKIGHFLHERRTKPEDIVGEWDGAGKGVLHKSVFKLGIKNLNLPNVTQVDLDQCFAELLGNEKALSTETMKVALRDAKRDAASLGERMKVGRAKAKSLRDVEQLVTAALKATETCEESERQLEAMRTMPPVGVRFGRHLAKMSLLAPRDVMKRWDDDGSGGVDIDELANALCNIQFKFEEEDVPELFELLDQNADGDIDLEDLKTAINAISNPKSGMISQHVAAEKQQARVCAEKKAEAKAAQQVCQKALSSMGKPNS